jgi:hypothetical protein
LYVEEPKRQKTESRKHERKEVPKVKRKRLQNESRDIFKAHWPQSTKEATKADVRCEM